jgi:ketosteroid isomerase-like protein
MLAQILRTTFIALSLISSLALSAAEDLSVLQMQVRNTEIAFAATMAERDFAGFKSFLSAEAIFLSGDNALRGAEQVALSWQAFFTGKEVPFSWRPETVVVLDSGTLALSTGPVFDASGKLISYYTSTWRQELPGVWKIVLDKGNKACAVED